MIRYALVASAIISWSILLFLDTADAGYGRYSLAPDKVADGVFVFWGKQEPLTWENGGNIVNTGFIIGSDTVLVVDTGPTKVYAAEMISAIRSITSLPIRHAVVTHHHPDHSFGIQQFKKNNANIYMHKNGKALLELEGPTLLGFLETLIGANWVTGTKIDKPTHTIGSERTIDIGNRLITIFAFNKGHTPGDLVVHDNKTGTLFTGDLVFYGRAASVPHATIPVWLRHLTTLLDMKWTNLIPGHGPIVTDKEAFDELRSYLTFLNQSATNAVKRGDTLAEALQIQIPTHFRHLAVVESEFQRSMVSLFRKLEMEEFDSTVPTY